MHQSAMPQDAPQRKGRARKSPTKFEWYKRYPRAYLDATRRLSLGARGAYSDLLDLMYLDEHGRIPDDNRWIACALHVTIHRWRAVRAELFAAGKLFAREGYIYNAKAREVHAERLEAAAATITSRNGVHHYDLFSFGINGGVTTDKKKEKKISKKEESIPTVENPITVGASPPPLASLDDLMIADLVKWMGSGADEPCARKWLATTIAAYGQKAVRDAYAHLQSQTASGVLIARPIPMWTKVAQRMADEDHKPPASWQAQREAEDLARREQSRRISEEVLRKFKVKETTNG